MKSSLDSEEIAEFTEEERKRAIKMIKREKAYRMGDGGGGGGGELQVMLHNWEGGGGGSSSPTEQTSSMTYYRQSILPTVFHEAKIVFLFKKGDPQNMKNYRPISLLSHSYKTFTRLLQTRIKKKKALSENQAREQAGFRKTILHQTICKL